jgi:hypothetical protein
MMKCSSSDATSSMISHLHRRPRRGRALLALVCGATLTASCQSLEVSNPNTPDVGAVFGSGQNLEAALLGSWRAFWGVAQGARTNATYPVKQLSILANEMTSADVADAVSPSTIAIREDGRTESHGTTCTNPWHRHVRRTRPWLNRASRSAW